MHKLIEYVCEELESLEKKAAKGSMSAAEIEYADKLASLKKNLLKGDMLYDEVMEDGEYSSAMRPMSDMGETYRGGSYNRNRDGGMSYARGDGRGRGRNAKRDSMGRYSSERGYSRDGQEMADQLRDLMEDAPDESVRRDIERLLRKVEQM
jgi:hypothetical protein